MATYYYWTGSGVTARANSTAYTSGARIVPALTDTAGNAAVAKRWVWECTTGGTSGAAVPTWPATVVEGDSLTDGTVTWKARIPGYSAGGTTVDWTFATIYFGYAVLAANATGDFIYAHYTSQEELTVDTTYTLSLDVRVISVNKDSSNAPTAMGTGGWVGNSTTNRSVTISTAPDSDNYLYGMTFRTAGSTADGISLSGAGGAHVEYESCYFWAGNTGTGVGVRIGSGSDQLYNKYKNCTFRFGATNNVISPRYGRFDFEGCVVSSAGSAPSNLFDDSWLASGENEPGGEIRFIGCDLSHVTGTLVASFNNQTRVFWFSQCKFGSNVTVLAAQGSANKSWASVNVFDCASGDTHTFMGYYDAFGSCVSDSTIYYTTGAAAQSWKIVTTANCSYYTPFVSPFVDWYNTGTTSITPYIEILRDGSTTAFQNDEVWAEFWVKTTSGSTQSTEYSDRMALLGTPANQAAGAGTGSWTGEAASAWSGKVDSGSAVTPAEVGAIRGRVVVGEPSITVYVDPQIRT